METKGACLLSSKSSRVFTNRTGLVQQFSSRAPNGLINIHKNGRWAISLIWYFTLVIYCETELRGIFPCVRLSGLISARSCGRPAERHSSTVMSSGPWWNSHAHFVFYLPSIKKLRHAFPDCVLIGARQIPISGRGHRGPLPVVLGPT